MKPRDGVEAFFPYNGGTVNPGRISTLSVTIKVDLRPYEEAIRRLQQAEWERKGRELAELIRRLEDWLNA